MITFIHPSGISYQSYHSAFQKVRSRSVFTFLISTFLCLFSPSKVWGQCELTLTPANIRSATCGGKDGSFQVQVSGITAPYQYRLDKIVNGQPVLQENGTLIAGTPTFVFLTGGTYKVSISKNSDACSGAVTVEVPQEPLTITLSNISLPSCTTNNGSFALDVSGITFPYQYALARRVNGSFVPVSSGTQTSVLPTSTGLGGGVYQVTLTKGSCGGSFIVYLNCEALGNEGCSPGYWKNQTQSWLTTNYSPTQTLETVFNIPDAFGLDNTTLLEGLQLKGGNDLAGAAQILLRAAVAAILNAMHGDVDYSIKLLQVIADVNAALNSGNRNTMTKLASTLDKYNNKNCPIDAGRNQFVRRAESSDLQVLTTELHVKALPNPTAHYFNVQVEGGSGEKINLRVVDMQGRLIEQRTGIQPTQTIRLGENYIPGVYLLDVQQGIASKQLKLLKGFN